MYDGKSLDDSAEQAGFERGLGRVILSALDGHASEEDLSRGDVIRLVVQEVTVLGDFARYAGVEALELRPLKGEPLRVYYFDMPGERGYYDVKGRAPHDGGWRKPIPGAPITSRFNLKRLHPVLKKVMPHLGTDFGAPSGTPIGASAPGTVTFVGYSGPAGNLVKIAHPGGVETGYAHLSRFAEGLKVGAKVKRIELVGYVGSTGRSTGPHLHFSASKNKEYFDAEKLNLDAMRTLAGDHRAALDTVIVKYNVLLDAIVLPEPLAEGDRRRIASHERKQRGPRRTATSGTEGGGGGDGRTTSAARSTSELERADTRRIEHLPHGRGAPEDSGRDRRRRSRTLRGRRTASHAERDHERAAVWRRVLDRHLAAVSLGDVLDEREPDAAAAHVLAVRRAPAHEALEDALAVVRSDAGTAIGHADLERVRRVRRTTTSTLLPSAAYLSALSTRLMTAISMARSSRRTGASSDST